MTVVYSDFTFTFSGGDTNTDPTLSLGGVSSSHSITSQRLFSDVTPDQTTSGYIDYRCFYLHNENLSDSLYNAEILIASTVPGDVVVNLGLYSSNERQNVTVLAYAGIIGGSFTLTYTDIIANYDFVVNWDSDLATWTSNFQTAIRTVSNLDNVTVTPNPSGGNLIFEIDFVGIAANRFHDLLVVKTNSLTHSGPAISIGISRAVNGGPINSVASEIDMETTIPNGVEFYSPSENFTIGEFRSLDMIPIWIRRTTPAGTVAIENDGFTFRIVGQPIA